MKKILLSLFWIITIWLVNFSSAWFEVLSSWNITTIPNQSNFLTLYDLWTEYTNFWDIFCFSWTVNQWWWTAMSSSNEFRFWVYNWNWLNSSNSFSQLIFWTIDNWTYKVNNIFWCVYIWWKYQTKIWVNSTSSSSLNNISIDYEVLHLVNNWWWSSSCDYSWYILESEINQSYCVNNNLCPSNSSNCDYSEYESTIQTLSWNLATCQWLYSTCDNNLSSCSNELNFCLSNWWSSSCSWDIQWSSLYINNIQHLWASSIFVNIPEEISWSYTNENDEFDLDIEWYNLDIEYIDSIIRTQNYKPTSEDFTELVKMLAPYSKILIFCLFMFIIWAWIKKPFKSKKI